MQKREIPTSQGFSQPRTTSMNACSNAMEYNLDAEIYSKDTIIGIHKMSNKIKLSNFELLQK